MTYAAEPYARFVADLLTSLTGGIVREQFRFLPEEEPFRLAAPAAVIPNTLQVYGLAGGVYTSFRRDTDYVYGPGSTIVWQQAADGGSAKNPVRPDPGSTFFVNYEYVGADPQITDRNPGSVTRLLAESFGREYAVLSRQMEAIYQAGFIDTAGGRDLEQLAALIGVSRRRRPSATSSVVFSRLSPAPADVSIPAGTRISTAEPPAAVFETTEDRILQRGNLSVEAPIQAMVPGATGIAPAGAVRVMNRPILGVDEVANPQATRFSGTDETDAQLRARVRRSLEGAGKATTGALLGALTTLPGLREKDIRIGEDYLAHPGVVTLNVALPEIGMRARAVELIEETRPVGIRVEHNIDAPRPLGPATPGAGSVAAAETFDLIELGDVTNTEPLFAPVAIQLLVNPTTNNLSSESQALLVQRAKDAVDAYLKRAGIPINVGKVAGTGDLFLPVNVEVKLTPTTLSLSAEQRAQMVRAAEDIITSFLKEAGIGESLVYNRLVANLMQMESVLDVALNLYSPDGSAATGRRNLIPSDPNAKPIKGNIDVQIGGALVVLDVAIEVTLIGAALAAPDKNKAKKDALVDAADALKGLVATLESGTLTADVLKGALGSATYTVGDLHYWIEYVDAGIRVHQQDVALPLTGMERLWIRKVALLGEDGQ